MLLHEIKQCALPIRLSHPLGGTAHYLRNPCQSCFAFAPIGKLSSHSRGRRPSIGALSRFKCRRTHLDIYHFSPFSPFLAAWRQSSSRTSPHRICIRSWLLHLVRPIPQEAQTHEVSLFCKQIIRHFNKVHYRGGRHPRIAVRTVLLWSLSLCVGWGFDVTHMNSKNLNCEL